jgi:alpha-L-rhamnosidase
MQLRTCQIGGKFVFLDIVELFIDVFGGFGGFYPQEFPMKPRLLSLLVVVGLAGELCARAATVGDLHCESLRNPEGIDALKPRLSWTMESRRRGDHQTAYQVVAASSRRLLDQGQYDLWDSGKVVASDSILIPYGGKGLASLAECHWKVRIWDQADSASSWSVPSRWSMGLLSAADWKAKWIGLDEVPSHEDFFAGAKWIWYPDGEPAQGAPVGVRAFYRTIDLPQDKAISKAVFYWTADNEGTLIVNGTHVGVARDFHAATTFDVAGCLHPGTNTLEFRVRNTGDSPNPAGLIAALHLEYKSGQRERLVTDGQWRVLKDGATNGDLIRVMVLGAPGMSPWGPIRSADNQRRLAARWLRRDFGVDSELVRATVCYSGLGWSELWINGKRVGDEVLSPALSDYSKRVYYITHDVTGLLRRGSNAVGVVLGNGRYFSPRLDEPVGTRTFGYPKLLLQLCLEFKDGHKVNLVSDASWKLTAAGPIVANNEYDGEDYDANRELGNWSSPGYKRDGWIAAHEVAAPEGVPSAPMMNPIRVTGSLKPVSVREQEPGVWIYDFGQNFAGWCRLSATGPKGLVLTLRHAERLTEKGALYLDNLRSAKVTDRFTLKGTGLEVFEPRFTLHGFRYVELRGFTGKPTPDMITGLVVNDDLESAGEFRCSNPVLNTVLSNVIWGVRGNYRSIPTDCPQRDERQGWLGDRSAESRGEGYLFRHGALYAKWVRDMSDSQRPDGVVSDVCPNYWSFYNDSITWPGSMAIIPETLRELTGDRAVIQREYPAIALWLKHHISLIQNGLSTRDTYGDWCVPPENLKLIHSEDPARKTAGPLIATTYLYHCLNLGTKYAQMLGKTEDVKLYAVAADTLKKGLNDHYYKKDLGYYDNGSACSCILPLAFGMVPQDQVSRVVERLVQKIARENNSHPTFGLIGGQWVYSVLTRHGQVELAYTMATQRTYPSLGYMAEQGATTIWELWNGNTADPAMNSGNHVMLVGDFVTWLYECLAGIAPDPNDPGFHHIVMRPTVAGDLSFVRASHVSPYGRISSQWNRKTDAFLWNVTVPPNTRATLYIPATDAARISESGSSLDRSAGLVRAAQKDEPGRVCFEAAPGTYRFKVDTRAQSH